MEELDLKELIDMFLEKKILIILVVVIFALCGAIYTLRFITPMYQSKTSLVLVQSGLEDGSTLDSTNSITSTDLALNSKLVENYREIAISNEVVGKVIENLSLKTSVDALKGRISVSTISNTELLQIVVSDSNPQEACRIANEMANVFIEKAYEFYKVSNVAVLDKAEVNNTPYNINLAKNVIIFAFVGLILVSGYILLINMLDTTVKTDTDIEKTLGVPVLGSIVLTDEAVKKKSNGKRFRTNLDLEHDHYTGSRINVDNIAASLNKNNNVSTSKQSEEDSVSMFSYMNKETNENKSSNNNNDEVQLPKSAARKNAGKQAGKKKKNNSKKGDRK